MTFRGGFTLVEVLVAVMLTGMLTALALAPVVITVRRTVETQEQYADTAALSRTMSFMGRDLQSAMRLSPNVLAVKDHQALGGKENDILMVMSTSPAVQGMSAGTVVYTVAEGGILHGNVLPGLYRWVFPGILPKDVKTDTLNPEEAQLVLPYVEEFSVEIPVSSREDDRQKEYSGLLPKGIYIKISRERRERESYNEEDDEFNTIERIIAFP